MSIAGQTYRRTPDRYTEPAPHTMRVASTRPLVEKDRRVHRSRIGGFLTDRLIPANVGDDSGYRRRGDATAYNGPIAGENGDDVVIECSPPTNQSARTCADLTSLDTLFVNIQGLLNMAVKRSRDREEQITYEKGNYTRVHC